MSESFFGLHRPPFPAVAEPSFVFEPAATRAARLAIDGLVARWVGLIVLEADAGVGKTEFLRTYQRQVDPDRVLVLLLRPTDLEPARVSRVIGEALRGPFKPTPTPAELDLILLERRRAGRATVLIIDDAERLGKAAWPVLDVLAMLGSPAEPAVTILLSGRPQLSALLAGAKRSALQQRTTAKVNLRPFSPVEASAFLRDRLLRAGAEDVGKILDAATIERLALVSAGNPGRLIPLASAVLSAGAARREQPVGASTVERAIRLADRPVRANPVGIWSLRLGIAAVICVAAVIGWRVLDTRERSALVAALPAPVKPASAAIPAAPPLPAEARPIRPATAASVPPPQDYHPVDVFLLPAARGDTLRKLYDVAYRDRDTRPSFDQFRIANPDLSADQRLGPSDLVAFPGPLGPNAR